MTIETLRQEHNSRPRNKLIAQVFYLAGFIEIWGRGIQKVDDAFKRAGLTVPDYSEIGGGILTIIPRPTATDSQISPANDTKDDANVHKELTERQRVILSVIEKDCTITAQKIAQKGYAVGQRTLMTELSTLQSFGVLHREGGRKNGRWVIENRK